MGYYVDTVGVNAEMFRRYVEYQEKHKRMINSYRCMKCEGRAL